MRIQGSPCATSVSFYVDTVRPRGSRERSYGNYLLREKYLRSTWLVLATAALLSYVQLAIPREFTDRGEAEVIGVIDGDTLDVLLSAELAMRFGFPARKSPMPLRLRLDQIDTPERGQPWGSRAKQALSQLVFRKTVQFRVVDIDRYDRGVAQVRLGDLSINEWLIAQGHAWTYRRYAKSAKKLCALEDEARRAHRGLWSLPAATWEPPWQWRKHNPVEPYRPSLDECLAASATSRRS